MILKATVLKCSWALAADEGEPIQSVYYVAVRAFSRFKIFAAVWTRDIAS